MAKIDTSKISGFDEMSAEDKLNALLGYEFEAPASNEAEMVRLKNSLNKACSEAKAYKDELRAKQTEAERAEADRQEAEKKLQEELAAYRTRERLSSYKANYMAAGYDAETAEALAKALPEGVPDDFFATQKSFLDKQKQTLLSEAINKQPGLSVGTPPSGTDAEKAEMDKFRRYIGLK